MATRADELLYIFHHLFLPPELPQQDDYRAELEIALLSSAIDGLIAWKNYTGSTHLEQADAAILMLRNLQRVYYKDGSLNETEVFESLAQLAEDTAVPLLIREQNAGVLVRRSNNRYFFEVFEVSPKNVATMSTKGRLQRPFPAAAVVLSESDFQDRTLQKTIAHSLVDMSKHAVKEMQPKVLKAGNLLDEDRDTTHPGMVSEVFFGFLRSIGEPVKCPTIVKNMRDDVLWDHAPSPWRRSPSWLLTRVALQLGFNRKTPPVEANNTYKEAILSILCHTLSLAIEESLSSEVLFSMSAKLARRLLKMGPAIDNRVSLCIQKTMKDAHTVIARRWSNIQQHDGREINLSRLSQLDYINNSYVSLPNLDKHISWMNTRKREQRSNAFQPSSTIMEFPPHDLPRLPQDFPEESKSDAIANLEAFETWVALHCRKWSQNNLDDSCNELGSLIATYHKLAGLYYSKNPEALSIMLLTIVEMWIACDETAVRLCPLLGQYDTGVQRDVLQNLLLPFVSQMQRLHHVEQYLDHRASSAPNRYPTIYNLESQQCFPVKFFDLSKELQDTYEGIIRRAEQEKRAKLAELRDLKMEYDRLMALSSQLEHQYKNVFVRYSRYSDGYYELRHASNCQKCKYETEAANLSIHIHEWPLPRSITKAKGIVFERYIPRYLQSWRQATFYLLRNIIGMQYATENSPRSQHSLSADPHLPNVSHLFPSNIGLLSEDKPQVVTHREAQKVSTATETSVCLNNGLNYQYFDFEADQFVRHPLSLTDKVLTMCTYHLPTPSENLQKYLLRPASLPDGPGSNVALANQSETPDHMSVEEARDLAMLPLGHRIQLHNILVQLAAPSLDFRKEETTIFILQCLYQSGPPKDTPLRSSHDIADDERFATCLLENVAVAWHRIKENWESAQALGIFVAIATRLLSLASSQRVQQKCLELLSTFRTGAFAWAGVLRDKSHKAATQDDRTYFKSKSVDIALICASCFDVEHGHLSSILGSDSDASIFVQCCILIQEGKPAYDPASELTLACLRLRFRRLMYRSSPILVATHSGLSDAIQKSWSAYRPGSEWRVASNTTHWLVTDVPSGSEGIYLQVHYNLISGEFLVNGLPLSRPPREYEAHPMWPTLFGRAAVEVMPTSAAGMQFSAKLQHEGYNIDFGLSPGNSSRGLDLLIQASNSTSSYETIPTHLLQGMFPDRFVNDYIHWYNNVDATVEFRPREKPWHSGASTWTLSKNPKGQGWILREKGTTLIDVNSKTATAIADVLSPLAERSDIHIYLQPSDEPSLEVEIPALRLGFFLTSGKSDLRSREFRGLSVDGDQSLGTLIGFANKLILRRGSQRLVLVPEGPVSWQSVRGHIRVMVSKAFITTVHPLHIDSVLGRLTDNGDLQGKLFLSYLHALTSYCLPDPLTKKTGTEQALWILNSAAVRSFDQLSKRNIDTLAQIAQLNPTRRYYPLHEQVMQTVSWVPDLSYLSQHDGFFKAAAAIFEQAKEGSLFHPGSDSRQLNIRAHIDTNEFLMERDRIRSSTFRISSFGAEEYSTAYDVTYHSRDCNQESTRGTNAYVLSSIVYHGRTALHTRALRDDELWSRFSTTETVNGPHSDQSVQLPQLRYSAKAANSGLVLSQWPALHKALSTEATAVNKFSVMSWLSAIAASDEADMELLQILALSFTASELRGIEPPSIQSCCPPEGYEVTPTSLENTIRSNLIPLECSPDWELPRESGESEHNFYNRRRIQYNSNKERAVRNLVAQLRSQWPTETPSIGQMHSDYVNIYDAESTVRKQFKACFDNLRLFQYLQRIARAISHLSRSPVVLRQPGRVTLTPLSRPRSFVSARDLFASPSPTLPEPPRTPEFVPSSNGCKQPTDHLKGLIDVLKKTASRSKYEASYIEDLYTSMISLQGQESARYPNLRNNYSIDDLRRHLECLRDYCKESVDGLQRHLTSAAGATKNEIVKLEHGPRLSPLLFLQQLSSGAWGSLSPGWRSCITRYGVALSNLQRAERLVRAASSPSDEDLIKELRNIGHRTWDPLEHPEWLLLEVESGITIRDVQVLIASEMMNPSSRSNAVMQLNMGEGKSSVIVPMIAAELANGSQLARVVVAKPQSKQMAQMLTSKLGGLLGRRVYHMPFSRALKINSGAMADTIDKLVKECEDNGGVLLVQPEHILSFQLMGLEYYCSSSPTHQAIGESFIRIQDFLENNSRDIIDESDENFSPKFELIYTMGSQRPVELSPARWICMQQVLNSVRSLAADVAAELPQAIAIGPQQDGGFPRVRILKTDAGELLVRKVARHICARGFEGFPIARQQEHVREAVFKYITENDLSREEIDNVERGVFWTESIKPLLLLLRGILAGGVLAFTLGQKRWRVNFGLANARTPPTRLAVPYRAKDNPTPRSEFSHPDVVIGLTSLTYYYGGLEDEDLFIALGHLMDSDQAETEYYEWTKDAPNMPAAFCQLEGINLKDRPQCIDHIFPHLKYGKSVIDYFLGHIVFPKEVKEFPYKLSASGWDIGKAKAHCTTGFSGTNDSRKLLPLDVEHLDLPSQKHTNALVLEYLLQPENSVILLPDQVDASMTGAEHFLETVVKLERSTRVILDVGAQILELNNQEVAESWLRKVTDTKTQAVVFVNDDDEVSVVDRRGRLELLQTSSYATQLDTCLVFLDQAHTRGIDLKLPDDYRAAVTLGAHLTKDELAQACMRLRKLGKGQSVVFCVSAEIRAKIQECTAKPASAAISVEDVLHWAISGTFAEIRRKMPLWAAQGDRFLRQEELWKSVQTSGVTSMSRDHAEKVLEDEAQSIEARYKPHSDEATSVTNLPRSGSQKSDRMQERCNEFGDLHFDSSTLEEEQERELSPEIEQERQVQRPEPAQPRKHQLHSDIENFVATGRLEPSSSAYMRAFDALRDASAAQDFEVSQLGKDGRLFATTDFAKTVVTSASDIGYVSDSYQRPVQWLLSGRGRERNSAAIDVILIISPYEAEKLMPKMRSAGRGRVTMHLYKPRCHAGHRSFDSLDFFTIPARQTDLKVPPTLAVQLNLFAGQLYFGTYGDYLTTCAFLGLAADVPKEGQDVAADGYIRRDRNGKARFDKSPVRFLRGLTSKIRRNGQGISKTHVGGMLEGKLLQTSDVET
ncbi:hypothetical protein GGR53DRAFT_466937 [Hypoxylon sp. FL1150]|nr:hypothetical protein GGR53DRAFT_466937 [Hypoxylon sp. FL1150]